MGCLSLSSTDIQSLPADVVNRIAAGEVIDSLAAVVRELVENSLDAGATRIVVSLLPDLWRVQVADNGCGMDLTNLQLCAKAHSTSKIRSSDDLWKITSLGFRGEALHGLAQLANLEILSRPQGEDSAGWRIVYDREGEVVSRETAAIAPGTIVTVGDIFGDWLLRRKSLPAMTQQLKAVQATIHQIALCHPRIIWQVLQNGRPWFNLSPGTTAQQIVPQILRRVRETDLQLWQQEVIEETSKVKSQLELVIGLPDRCHRRKPDWVKVAVNGRLVRSQPLEQTILAGFARTLPRDRYPVCFLHLTTDPSNIDWNRHPAKAEIYLQNLDFWRSEIGNAIASALRINAETLPETLHNQRVTNLIKASENKGQYQVSRDLQTKPKPSAIDKTNDISLIELRAVGQVNKTYIIAEHSSGAWLIEQHIAHERVLYEQLQDGWQIVPLKTPIVLNDLTTAQVEQLERINIEIEPFGDRLWAIRSIPAMLQMREDCSEAILELSLGGDLQTAQVATACRSAIRNGTPLSLPEMQTLLDEWKNTRNPRTCPHGRPIYLPLEETSLARFFRRHWVIGKSHGI